MWSGPRNISTALMRAWESRDDTYVCDEPFYAHYLDVTGLDHPVRDEVIASQPTDCKRVIEWLTGPVPEQKRVFYQKHMAHHLLPHMDRGWLDSVVNVFLIRDPGEMITSLIKVTPKASIADTGLPQQWELFERTARACGAVPPVIDARDVLENPRDLLRYLCEAVGVDFQESMLSWKPGPRETDGVWAKYWYSAVEASTGFQPYTPKNEPVPDELRMLHEACREFYERLHACRIVA